MSLAQQTPSPQRIEAKFRAADVNHDGKLTLEEAKAGMPRVAKICRAKEFCAIRRNSGWLKDSAYRGRKWCTPAGLPRIFRFLHEKATAMGATLRSRQSDSMIYMGLFYTIAREAQGAPRIF
jgi:hypothetical protein